MAALLPENLPAHRQERRRGPPCFVHSPTRLNSATPKAGTEFELDAIASVFIGGASMTGGTGKIVGVVVGALIIEVMNMGMSILGIGIEFQQMIKGLVLLAAVIFDVYNKRR